MVAENFDANLKRVLVHEGGYSNDRDDPGGTTMWGITHFDYDAFRKPHGRHSCHQDRASTVDVTSGDRQHVLAAVSMFHERLQHRCARLLQNRSASPRWMLTPETASRSPI